MKKLALGLSASALPLLQRLKMRSHVDDLALTSSAASALNKRPSELLVGKAFELIEQYWFKEGLLVIVGAIGAVTRLISPLLSNKDDDPAVLVIDAFGKSVIPLLGGHNAGAENFARELAEDLGGQAILTGDASINNRLPLDSFGKSWGWKRSGNRNDWNKLMISQAARKTIFVDQTSGIDLWQKAEASKKFSINFSSIDSEVTNTVSIGTKIEKNCCWYTANLWIGIGCERFTSKSLLKRALLDSLSDKGLSEKSIAGIATIEAKKDELTLLQLATDLKIPIRFFSASSLSQITVPNPSRYVYEQMGTHSVAEASALIAAGNQGKLLQTKKSFQSINDERGAATISIALAKDAFAPDVGEIHLIGIGPGDLAFLTHDARLALARSVVWIGYSFYLDLIEPLRRNDQVRLESQLTHEKDRCKKALDLARQGVRVALISSGDSGIYGMAGLALELWLEQSQKERPSFQVHPGLSALQLAAARIGAPLMHDFCAISLSDKLIPWQKIEDRIYGAAIGDFVIALYNPKSKDRDWQLKRAVDLLLEHRSPSTPVLLARQLGRIGEELHTYELAELPFNKVDMLTLVMIGNSSTYFKENMIVAPRGY